MRKILCVVVALLTGCTSLMGVTSGADHEKLRMLLEHENSGGCVLVTAQGSGAWVVQAGGKFLVVGTYGRDHPKFEDCWKYLPTIAP